MFSPAQLTQITIAFVLLVVFPIAVKELIGLLRTAAAGTKQAESEQV